MPIQNPTIRVIDFYVQNIHQPEQMASGGLGTREIRIFVRASQSIAGEVMQLFALVPNVGEVVLLSTIL